MVEPPVNPASGTALLRVLSGCGAIKAAIAASQKAGYGARVLSSDADTGDWSENEIAHLRRMVLIAGALTLPVFVLQMAGHLCPPFHDWIHATIGMQTGRDLQFALTTLVMARPGRIFHRRGLPAAFSGASDMNLAVALGSGAAWGFSVISAFAPGLLPAGSAAVDFEAAAVIGALILLGRFLEARAKGRTGAATRSLVGLAPKTARTKRGGEVKDVAVSGIVVGDMIHVRPGEKNPVVGTVRRGESWAHESMLSGEPKPVSKAEGSPIIGGTVNGTGAFRLLATKVCADTVLAQIIRMVETAQGAKLPVQDKVNQITAWFAPAVIAVAALTVLAWLIFSLAETLGAAVGRPWWRGLGPDHRLPLRDGAGKTRFDHGRRRARGRAWRALRKGRCAAKPARRRGRGDGQDRHLDGRTPGPCPDPGCRNGRRRRAAPDRGRRGAVRASGGSGRS